MKNRESKIMERLAEAVIMQALNDLWIRSERKKSITFFTGKGFTGLARAAHMKEADRLRLLGMIMSGLCSRRPETSMRAA